MRVVILAGGRGTRLGDQTSARPKPMVEVGGRPLLWHIMHIYGNQGFRDFLVAAGYRGEIILDYFRRWPPNGTWSVEVVDTGLDTMTGGRLLRLRSRIGEEPFLVTYGDGLGDVDLGALFRFHRSHGRLATVTAVRPPPRFGALTLEGDTVVEFSEKPPAREGWINGGFFVFEPGIFEYLKGDSTVLERQTLPRLAAEGQLMAWRHEGFWQPMDAPRDQEALESLWSAGQAPWKTWI